MFLALDVGKWGFIMYFYVVSLVEIIIFVLFRRT
jgi:hypothetical protein